MNITNYSRNRFYQTLNDWEVPKEYADVMFGYFVAKHHPGSFFSALLANDFAGAIVHSHPANSIQGLKHLVGWLRSTMLYGIAWGTSEVVQTWLHTSPEQCREILVKHNLVYSEQDEIMLCLNGKPTVEPFFMD